MVLPKKLLWFAVAANLIGAFYGFVFFYGQQLLSTNPFLALFVPDCPLAALLFAAALLMLRGRISAAWFYTLVSANAIKYGFWTIFVLLAYTPFYFSAQTALLYSVLFVAHIGLLLEPIVLLAGRFKQRALHLLPLLLWFGANDAADYLLGTAPPIPGYAHGFMFAATLLMSVASALFVLLAFPRLRAFEQRPTRGSRS